MKIIDLLFTNYVLFYLHNPTSAVGEAEARQFIQTKLLDANFPLNPEFELTPDEARNRGAGFFKEGPYGRIIYDYTSYRDFEIEKFIKPNARNWKSVYHKIENKIKTACLIQRFNAKNPHSTIHMMTREIAIMESDWLNHTSWIQWNLQQVIEATQQKRMKGAEYIMKPSYGSQSHGFSTLSKDEWNLKTLGEHIDAAFASFAGTQWEPGTPDPDPKYKAVLIEQAYPVFNEKGPLEIKFWFVFGEFVYAYNSNLQCSITFDFKIIGAAQCEQLRQYVSVMKDAVKILKLLAVDIGAYCIREDCFIGDNGWVLNELAFPNLLAPHVKAGGQFLLNFKHEIIKQVFTESMSNVYNIRDKDANQYVIDGLDFPEIIETNIIQDTVLIKIRSDSRFREGFSWQILASGDCGNFQKLCYGKVNSTSARGEFDTILFIITADDIMQESKENTIMVNVAIPTNHWFVFYFNLQGLVISTDPIWNGVNPPEKMIGLPTAHAYIFDNRSQQSTIPLGQKVTNKHDCLCCILR
eukprot:276868_1